MAVHYFKEIIRRLGKKVSAKTSTPDDLLDRISRELEIFDDIEQIHELPGIYHYWSNKYLLPNFVSSGFSSIADFFAKNLAQVTSSTNRILSLGSGSCETEIEVAKLLITKGHSDFLIECLELNPKLLEKGIEQAKVEGLENHFTFAETDLNRWSPGSRYSGVMANHSLHHVVNLEDLFDGIAHSLEASGNFVINDMIGRNGHQRWPEALAIINEIWEDLPEKYRFNHQLKRIEEKFTNWDCSTEGFEGIRAQDILPELLKRFNFKYFYGFANVVGPFIDRGFGPNFDASETGDQEFVDRLHQVDEDGFKSGSLKPTQMLAVLTSGPVVESFFVRGLSPTFLVRR